MKKKSLNNLDSKLINFEIKNYILVPITLQYHSNLIFIEVLIKSIQIRPLVTCTTRQTHGFSDSQRENFHRTSSRVSLLLANILQSPQANITLKTNVIKSYYTYNMLLEQISM